MFFRRRNSKSGFACESGFTLLELILVSVIIIILISAVSVSIGGFFSRSRLRTAARELASRAVFARSRALTSGHPVIMKIAAANGEIELFEEQQNPSDNSSELVSLGQEWFLRLPENVSISSLEIADEQVKEGEITFFPDGGAIAAHLVLSLANPSASASPNAGQTQLWVDKITGRVRLE